MPTAELQALLGDVDGVALSVTPFGEAELTAGPKLQVVGRLGVGYDAVDVPALTRRRIPLMIVGTANSVTVAEHAMFMMMNLAKRGAAQAAMVREGRWNDKFNDRAVELYEKILLIAGFGRIGTRIARRCLGMEMTVLVYDPYVSDATRPRAKRSRISMRRYRAPISSPSIARRPRTPPGCSTPGRWR